MTPQTTRTIESTVDMIAASGAANSTPATPSGSTSTIVSGSAMSPTARPG